MCARKNYFIFVSSFFIFFLCEGFMSAATLYYGEHYPHGMDAVEYMRGAEGTWLDIDGIDYTYNYYQQYAHDGHPYDREQLIYEAQTLGYNRTCRDIGGHLLLDFNHDLEIDRTTGNNAYIEHNGRGTNGEVRTDPFKNFWFDDNWLARHMCNAYGKSTPDGLHDPGGHIRWSPVDGGTSRYSPYNSNTYVDLMCLDGLYYLGKNQINNAVSCYKDARDKLDPSWDSSNQRYDYEDSQAEANYKLGLFAMLSAQIMEHSNVNSSDRTDARQHYISARSHILCRQETRDGDRLSWKSASGIHDLMSTETVSCCALGLSSDARAAAYEAGVSPMQMQSGKSYYYRPHKVLSAVAGLSSAGHMCYGPYHNYSSGSYKARFYMRAPSPSGNVCNVDVYNSTDGQILASQVISANDFASSNKWTCIELNFSLASTKIVEFRVYWYGNSDLDVSTIRIDQ